MPRDPAQSFHAYLTQLPEYEGQVAAYHFFPPRKRGEVAAYAGAFAELLARAGLTPYEHQAAALRAAAEGRDVVVATATASGKSLAFQAPVLSALESGGTSLLLYPTKALAGDQLLKLRGLAGAVGLGGAAERIQLYDGDTAAERRALVRGTAGALLTNPDMLHYGILPYHAAWAPFLGRLRYLVLDELHAYRGVLGSHVANVVRRLLRVAALYGAEPTVLAASATVGNPGQHAERLVGRPFEVVADDSAPRGAREFVFWRPPLIQGGDRRRSANSEAAALAAEFVRSDVKSIFFCNSRKGAELVRRYAAGLVGDELAERIESYRAGYTPEARAALEDAFRNGALTVLTSTSALELGVDIGGVDAVVMVGYPGSKMAMWQRSGRAGRAGGRALTVLIPGADPLDEYYVGHPDALLDGPVEDAVADPFNDVLHPRHVVCAAAEAPVAPGEGFLAPWLDLPAVEGLVALRDGTFVSRRRYPHRRIELRGGGGRRVKLKDGLGATVGVTDFATALRDLHPGAVYLHQGEQYLVAELDLHAGVARLLPHIEEYYTQPRSETDIEVLGLLPESEGPGALGAPPPGVRVGRVRVTHTVTGYVRKRFFSEAALDERPLDLPEVAYDTHAMWFEATGLQGPPAASDLPAALHALEHTLIGLLPAFVLCERADVGGVSYPVYPPTGLPTVFIYDGHPGGVGYVRAGAAVFQAWLGAAAALLGACECQGGCPRCVLSPKCGNGNQFLDKRAAEVLARALLARTPSVAGAAA